MKPSSWDKQLGLASPLKYAASQSDQTNNPSKNEVRLDVSHHARISQRGGEKFFSLTSLFIGLSEFLDKRRWIEDFGATRAKSRSISISLAGIDRETAGHVPGSIELSHGGHVGSRA